MRVLIAVIALAAASGMANASSFETLGTEAPVSAPSIMVLGQKQVASVSIESYGVPEPIVIRDEPEELPVLDSEPPQAAVVPQAEPAQLFRDPLPRVIRGGMEGDAFARALPNTASGAAVEPTQPAAAQPRLASQPQAPLPVTPRIAPE